MTASLRMLCPIVCLLLWTTLGAAASDGFGIDVVNADLALAVDLLARSTGRQVILDAAVPRQNVTISFSLPAPDDAIKFFARSQGLIVDRFDGGYILMRPADAAARAPGSLAMKPIVLRFAQPAEVATMLAGMTVPGGGLTMAADDKARTLILRGTAAQVEAITAIVAAIDQPAFGPTISARTIRYSAGKPSEAVAALRAGLHETNPQDQLIPNDAAGNVVAVGTRDFLAKAASLLAAYDAYGEQVLYDVRIVEISPADDSSAIGFLTNGFNNTTTAGGSGSYGAPLNPFSLGYGYLNKTVNLFTQLDLMVEHGNAKVISSPRIVAQNNVQQMLNATEQYPILTSNVSNGVSTQTVTYQPIGLQLKVSPTIGSDRSVLTSIDASYSTILAFVQTYPVIGQRQTTGSFRIADDETLVLCGLISDEDSSTLEKAPVIGDLPLIGAFFRHLATTHRKTELVFLLTPHVRPKVLTTSDVLVPFPLPPQPSPEAAPPAQRLLPGLGTR